MTDEQLKSELSIRKYLDQVLAEIQKNFDSIGDTIAEQAKLLDSLSERVRELEASEGITKLQQKRQLQ